MGSEYGGTGPRKQMVQPTPQDTLTAGEEIILLNLTGTTNPYAPLDNGRAREGLDIVPKVLPSPRYRVPPGDRDDTGNK